MSLTQALSTALSGLKVNQASLSLVAANVANADTPGYTRKTVNQVAIGGNAASASVSAPSSARSTSTSSGSCGSRMPARPMRIPAPICIRNCRTSTASRAPTPRLRRSTTISRRRLQALSTSPDDPGARTAVINRAQLLTQQLNQMSGNIQGLRGDAELGIADAVTNANEAMTQIATLNEQIAAGDPGDTATAGAAGSARLLYRSAVAVDGYQRDTGRPQPGQHLHQFGNAARRHAGRADEVRCGGHDNAEVASGMPIPSRGVGTLTLTRRRRTVI